MSNVIAPNGSNSDRGSCHITVHCFTMLADGEKKMNSELFTALTRQVKDIC